MPNPTPFATIERTTSILLERITTLGVTPASLNSPRKYSRLHGISSKTIGMVARSSMVTAECVANG
jgi:hypothetical protein